MPDISVDTRMANAKPSTKQGAKHRVKKTIAKVQCSAFRKQMNRSGDTSVPPALPLLTASYALKHIGAWVGLMPDEGSIPQTLDFDDSNSTFMSNTLASCNPDFLDHRHDLLDVRARVARHIYLTDDTLVGESVAHPANSWVVSGVETETLCEDTFDFEPEYIYAEEDHISAMTTASPKLSAMSRVEALCTSSSNS
ncbi:hypothetical protein BDV97DRAFT_409589 [Delphinella strobiligena]|nr:hypothetical protein BDV97DRAFT_409589 [Delphinella strobiligena]